MVSLFSLLKLPTQMHFPQILRQVEQEMETVINVLQPGPLGVIEHKFSAAEVREAKAAVERAVANWQRNNTLQMKHTQVRKHIEKGRRA